VVLAWILHLLPRTLAAPFAGRCCVVKAIDRGGCAMSLLKWALIFAVIALVAGLLGFVGVEGVAADIARFLFFLFVALVVLFVILGIITARTIAG
jgi:uncharacterized membrane protein YtjA (UPF0391 family)